MSDVKKARIVCMITGILGIVSLAVYIFSCFKYISYFGLFEYLSFFTFSDYAICLGMCVSITLMFLKKSNVLNIIFAIVSVLYTLYFVSYIFYLVPILSKGEGFGLKLLYLMGYILFIFSIISYNILYFLSHKITEMLLKISKISMTICIVISIAGHIILLFATNDIPFYIDFIFIQCGIYIWFYPRSLIKRKPKNISTADRIQSEIDQLDKDFAFGNISREEYQERKNAIIDSVIK